MAPTRPHRAIPPQFRVSCTKPRAERDMQGGRPPKRPAEGHSPVSPPSLLPWCHAQPSSQPAGAGKRALAAFALTPKPALPHPPRPTPHCRRLSRPTPTSWRPSACWPPSGSGRRPRSGGRPSWRPRRSSPCLRCSLCSRARSTARLWCMLTTPTPGEQGWGHVGTCGHILGRSTACGARAGTC